MAQRFFSGRESWVFRAQDLDELCGFHPELVAGALEAEERIHYLLYSPLRETTTGPFGNHGPSGSHALVLTGARAIISCDSHAQDGSRTVCAVPYRDIFSVELGEALTLGWLVFRYAAAGAVASETVFFQSTGIDLFRMAIRIVRGRETLAVPAPAADAERHPSLAQAPAYLRSQLLPVLLEGERVQAVVHTVQQWRTARGRRPSCIIPDQLCVVSEQSLVIAESERPHRPGALAFAVRTTCVDRRVVRRAAVAHGADYPDLGALVLELACGGGRCQFTCLADGPAAHGLREALIRAAG
jgi:hypothetical protein